MDWANVERAAFDYLSRGWSVIPLHARGKRPAVRWQEYQHRLASEQEVKGWFDIWPNANLGIVTGAVSGLAVLDVDPQHGGVESLQECEEVHEPLPNTVEAVTGGGGRHVYFAYPGVFIHNRVGLKPGIDLRGDGGYIVAPPSIHPSGHCYTWKSSHHPKSTSLADMPNWLMKLATTQAQHRGHSLTHWRNLVKEGVNEGERNNTIASMAGLLLWRGVDSQVVLDLLLCWNAIRCRPPLSEDEVARTVDSITRLHSKHKDDLEDS